MSIVILSEAKDLLSRLAWPLANLLIRERDG
jgi:hypothetical protein